jgi:Acetoacetate decarboxylase (ADC)
MNQDEVRARAYVMPLTSPAYPMGPYRFVNREFLIITYRTDPQKLRALVPEPLEVDEPLVKFEFIRMPDATGFGDYTESGQVVPVSFRGRKGGYTHCMFLNDHPPIAGGRELWGFPKKLAEPTLKAEIDTLVGTLHYGPLRIAIGTMGYKHQHADLAAVKAFADGTQLPAQDHTPCRRHGTHLRAGRIAPARCRAERRLDRTGRSSRSSPTPWRRSPSCRCWRSSLRNSHHRRPHAWPRQGRARLSGTMTGVFLRELTCVRR